MTEPQENHHRRFVIVCRWPPSPLQPFRPRQHRRKARIEDAATVLTEISAVPEKDVPAGPLEQSRCVMVVPSLKQGGLRVRR